VDVLKKTVFCGVLRCFVVFCGVVCACFSVFHKTAQNRLTSIQNAQNEQNTLCAIQRNTVLCIFLSLRKCLQETFAKHVQNIAKRPQNTAKHCFQKTLAKHHKHPQNTRKTPQNTAKHHKTHLLTKQTELANKPLRSRGFRLLLDWHSCVAAHAKNEGEGAVCAREEQANAAD